MKEKIDLNSDTISLRKYFGEDSYSPIDVFSILNNSEDFTIVFYPMSERISGICIRDEKSKLIAINSALSYGRQRYTAAHELCHLFFHENLKSIVCAKDIEMNKDPQEQEANMFASYFLMPYDSLKDFVKTRLGIPKKSLSIFDVVKIEQNYGLSRQAALWRLINEGYLSRSEADTMKTGIILSAIKAGFDDKLYLPAPHGKQYNTLGKYIKLAGELKDRNLVSNGKYEELLLNAFRSDIVYGPDVEGEENYD